MTPVKLIIKLILLFSITIAAVSQPVIKNNFSILDSLTGVCAEKIIAELKNKDIKQANIKFTAHSAEWLVKQKILDFATKAGITLISDSNFKNSINIEILVKKEDISFSNNINDREILERIASVSLSAIITYPDGKIVSLDEKSVTYNDKLSRETVDFVQSREYGFARASVPAKELTIFEEFAEPIIIIGSAILTVVLLFTIRSG
jgi:hypothetical protein